MFNFQTSQLPVAQSYEVLPAGEYILQIVKAENKFTKAGDGQFFKLEFMIADGDFKGRKVFGMIMHTTTSYEDNKQAAINIGLANLRTILEANQVGGLTDPVQLHGLFVGAVISVKEYNGEQQNEIKKYKHPNEVTNTPKKAQPAPQGFQAPVAQPQAAYGQQPVGTWNAPQPSAQPVTQQTWQQPQTYQVPQPAPQVQNTNQWNPQPQQSWNAQPAVSLEQTLDDSIPF